jgi:hypothetical protein
LISLSLACLEAFYIPPYLSLYRNCDHHHQNMPTLLLQNVRFRISIDIASHLKNSDNRNWRRRNSGPENRGAGQWARTNEKWLLTQLAPANKVPPTKPCAILCSVFQIHYLVCFMLLATANYKESLA